MINDNKTILKISDWVKGVTRNDELIIGFIDSMNIIQEAVYVVVAESDNEELIGKTIPLPIKQVESIPSAKSKDAGQLEFLIDLALSTGDKEWFNELSAELNSKKQSVN
ncbi:IDEAL domain-containing protein [Planococcus shenhongbingii]|uniref:IDEAL domain-containing protein n=1 Tax=Planococcus shenhongbingii TaxID=3058398 RepID=A0ABT8NGU0_9BACL|nr:MULTISPECIES: IDEAL domain-containing protein [unclassified Planococcus (in: firmicutes)]MDN7247041.1 IDEAL domain-containing protein [Planococcus sp. N017]WKA56943.1 IDEAL domain-containing protein [Planococcus sp. N016]